MHLPSLNLTIFLPLPSIHLILCTISSPSLCISAEYLFLHYRKSLGTFKTLQDSKEAMHVMAALLADFIIELNAYVRANMDDFAWEGIYVYPPQVKFTVCDWQHISCCKSIVQNIGHPVLFFQDYLYPVEYFW